MSENHVKNVRAIESAFETGYYNYQKTGKYTVINFEQDLDNYFLDRAEHPEGVKEVRALMKHAENCAKKGVIWIGTANNPQEIDSAIIRAGRTDIKMAIGNLKNFAVSDTIKYLLYKYGEKERADSFNYSAIVDFMNETNSVYTPAELELFVSKAIQHRMSEKQTLNEDMIISEMLEFNKNDYPSINPETEKKFETDKTYISDLEKKDKEAAEAKALALAKKTAAKQAEEEKTKVKNNNP